MRISISDCRFPIGGRRGPPAPFNRKSKIKNRKWLPAAGFTLVELLVVTAIVLTMTGLLAMAVTGAVRIAHRTACASNLRQVGLALRHYLDEHDGWFFPLRTSQAGGLLWYFGFEVSGSASQGEGRRVLDRTRARLYPYLQSPETVEICPAFDYGAAYKPKYKGKWWTYGINYELSNFSGGRNIAEIRPQDAGRTVLFADSAWINTFQAPASPKNPLVEEWFYIQRGARYVQFRHDGLANVLFADWHVDAVGPAAGSLDPRLPRAMVGCFDDRDVLFEPRAGK